MVWGRLWNQKLLQNWWLMSHGRGSLGSLGSLLPLKIALYIISYSNSYCPFCASSFWPCLSTSSLDWSRCLKIEEYWQYWSLDLCRLVMACGMLLNFTLQISPPNKKTLRCEGQGTVHFQWDLHAFHASVKPQIKIPGNDWEIPNRETGNCW